MTFLAPHFFWLFLPFLALLLWRLWRSNEHRAEISTSQIWQDVLAEGLHLEPSKRQISMRVLVEGLAGSLLILALAQPIQIDQEALLIVVDRRGSMLAPLRVMAANKRASDLADENAGSSSIVELNGGRLGHATSWQEAIAKMEWNGEKVELITDHVPSAESLPDDWGLSVVSAPVRNVGIVAASGETRGQGIVEVFLALGRTPSAAQQSCTVEMSSGGTKILRSLPGDGSERPTLTAMVAVPSDAEFLLIKVMGRDDLSLDDQVKLWRPSFDRRLVISSSLTGTQGVNAIHDAATALGVRAWSGRDSDQIDVETVVSYGQPQPSAGGQLVFASSAIPSDPIAAPLKLKSAMGEFQDVPGLEDWRFSRVFGVPLAKEYEILVETNQGPVIVMNRERNIIHVVDEPAMAGWTEQPSFPLFLRAALASVDFKIAGDAISWCSRSGDLSTSGLLQHFAPTETLATTSLDLQRASVRGATTFRHRSSVFAGIAALLLLGLAFVGKRP
ncbi:MAG: hypothetical protein ACI97A_001730 [Planctomycetota bacterium]|jgi:hypothetical protein